LNALFQSTKSHEAAHRESAFRIFTALPTVASKEHLDFFKDIFLAGLRDQAPQVLLTNVLMADFTGPTFSIQGSL
jgi:hypothetical protein